MENKSLKLKPIIKYCFYVFFIVLLSFIGYILFSRGLDNKKDISVDYKVIPSIDYKVYLKENNFFDTPYLTKDSIKNPSFISSLIDYLEIDFNYAMNYSLPLSGDYTYYVRATLLANRVDDKDKRYWSKEYVLKDKVTDKFTDVSSYSINQKIKINYDEYNQLLIQFKKEYGLSIDGVLRVDLVANSNAYYEDNETPVKDETIKSLEIPLTQLSTEIKIDTDETVKNRNVLIDTISYNDKAHITLDVLGGICFFIVFVFIILLFKTIKKESKKQSKYIKELTRILTTYDSIIVNVDRVRDLEGYNVIAVNGFSELLDAYSEVRMPINFIEVEKNKECVFLLINNNIAWLYKMKDE